MPDGVDVAVAGEEAYVVGGAVRDRLLGRRVVDLDVACREPERAARRYRAAKGGAVFLLSERHGAWRVALPDGTTVDFTLLRGTIGEDLAGRDFTVNAIAEALPGRAVVDPLGGRGDLAGCVLRAVSADAFVNDPLRLLRAVRFEDELGLALEPSTEALVRRDAALVDRPAGERILAELLRLSRAGYRRLADLGLLRRLGGSTERLACLPEGAPPALLLVAALGEAADRLPLSNETRRFARTMRRARRPRDDSPRELHRFRRATEPWALEALALVGSLELAPALRAARAADRPGPLLRGDELGVPPGPEVGRLLVRIAEERAAGTIATREEALALVERERRR